MTSIYAIEELPLTRVTPGEATEEEKLRFAFVSAIPDVVWSDYVGSKLTIRISGQFSNHFKQ
jgi:hypothetical protein